ncbi:MULTISPECIES: hypothetical protein [Bradyrhizobium]|uniref:hypothetical protein n=1 Tax=Bradyrhizobium TaxID=374 RepID=UPI001008BE04|nr:MULTISPECIES: hypothetical protein [Bradyrhizobium]
MQALEGETYSIQRHLLSEMILADKARSEAETSIRSHGCKEPCSEYALVSGFSTQHMSGAGCVEMPGCVHAFFIPS